MTPVPRLVAAVALGGAVGAVMRYLVGLAVPDADGFPWTTFAINVVGAFLLAALPALPVVRRSRAWSVGLGTGVLGGFTTLSATSEQARALLVDDRALLGAVYLVATLLTAVLAVSLADRLSTTDQRAAIDAEGGDE